MNRASGTQPINRNWPRGLLSAVVALASVTASAHHSTAAYDLKHDVILEGAVQVYQWTNPHCWVKVQGPDGKVWSIEFGTPSTSIRMGWSPATFKPGDKARFIFHPRIDGEASGALALVQLPDGSTLPGMTQPAGPIPGVAPKS